jgi:5'(3')-deoxyribonucleotidase
VSSKFRVGLDVDGVLRDFTGALRTRYALDHPTHKVGRIDRWDFSGAFPIGNDIWDYIYKDRTRELFEDAPPLPGAKTITRWLKRQGHEIWIVTSQPRGIEHHTLTWLKKNGIIYDHIAFTDAKARIECHVLLDDAIRNLNGFRDSRYGISVCMDRPWDREWAGERVYNFTEFRDLLSVCKTWSDLERVERIE